MRIEPVRVFARLMCIIGMKKKSVCRLAMKGVWNAEHAGSAALTEILIGIIRAAALEYRGKTAN